MRVKLKSSFEEKFFDWLDDQPEDMFMHVNGIGYYDLPLCMQYGLLDKYMSQSDDKRYKKKIEFLQSDIDIFKR